MEAIKAVPVVKDKGLRIKTMDIQKIQQYKSAFDLIAKDIRDEEGNSIEVWYARELQQVLGYARWENFVVAVGRAMESCKTLGISIDDHFREVTKMISLAKGAQREVQDFMLTRYACYLIAQNGDPKKEEVAFAQSYFAVQTRKAELIEERLNEVARLNTRERFSNDREVRAVWDEEHSKWWFSAFLDWFTYSDNSIDGRSKNLIFKKRLKLCVDWSKIDKKDYLEAMRKSTTDTRAIKALLQGAMTDRINDREIFMKGIDYSYYYEQE